MQPSYQFKNQLSSASIEIAGRLVREKHLRLRNQRASQRQALLFAARQLTRTMMAAIRQSHFAQPARSFLLSRRKCLPARQEWHGHIFEGGKFRQQVMELPHIADFAVTKLGGGILGERIHLSVGAVYGTRRGTIKRGEDVQQGTLAGARLPDDRQHRSLADLERQILKEHEFGFA